jgi:xanthine phosphoribosyltransferase
VVWKSEVEITMEDVEFEIRKIFKNFKFMSIVQPVDNNTPIIVGIKEGGVFFAKRIAEKYHLPCYFISCKFYDGKKLRENVDITEIPLKLFEEEKPVVLVDDVYDTGTTTKVLKKLFPNSKVVVLYKKTIQDEVDVFGDILARDVWAKFPWEKVKVE